MEGRAVILGAQPFLPRGLGWQHCPRPRGWEGKDGSNEPHGTGADNCINGMESFLCCKDTNFLEEMSSLYLLSVGPRWTDRETATRRMSAFRDSPYEWLKKAGGGLVTGDGKHGG